MSPTVSAWNTGTFTITGVQKETCQDAVTSWSGGTLTLLAVADGLGSHRNSHLGAQAAIDFSVKQVGLLDRAMAAVDPQEAIRTVDAAFESIVSDWVAWSANCGETSEPDAEPSNVQSTLACCYLWGPWIFIRSIGDSIVCVVSGDADCDLLISSVRDRTSGVATIGHHGLSDIERMNVYDPSVTQVLLATDGIERAVRRYAAEDDHNVTYLGVDPQLDRLLRALRRGGALEVMRDSIQSGLVWAAGGKGDDVGLALATRLVAKSKFGK